MCWWDDDWHVVYKKRAWLDDEEMRSKKKKNGWWYVFFFFFCSVCLADADGPIFLTSLSLTLDGSDMHASKAEDMISSSYSFAMQTEDI
jgi:hypothetical protein